MNNKTQAALQAVFEAPPSEGKREFLLKMRPREVSTAEMLVTQASYIRKSIWILSALILLSAVIGADQFPDRTVSFLGAITPFAAALGVLETYRSYSCHMVEMEQAARFSLRSVIFARMLIIGIVNLGMILLSSAVLSEQFGASILLMLSKILIPYLLTMAAGLHIERSKFGRNNSFVSIATATAVSIFCLWIGTTELPWKELLSDALIIAAGVILLAATGWEMFRTLQYSEVYA